MRVYNIGYLKPNPKNQKNISEKKSVSFKNYNDVFDAIHNIPIKNLQQFERAYALLVDFSMKEASQTNFHRIDVIRASFDSTLKALCNYKKISNCPIQNLVFINNKFNNLPIVTVDNDKIIFNQITSNYRTISFSRMSNGDFLLERGNEYIQFWNESGNIKMYQKYDAESGQFITQYFKITGDRDYTKDYIYSMVAKIRDKHL